MAARSTLSSAERRRLHRNIATLRGNGWTLRQIALELGLSVSALSNMLRSKDRGTSEERAARIAELVATETAPPSRARRGAPAGRRKHAAPDAAEGRSGRAGGGRKRRGRKTSARRTSRKSTRATSPAEPVEESIPPSEEGAALATAATVYTERVLPAATIGGLADAERRKLFVEQLEVARTHLSRAHESLQSTIESGSATVVTQPGVQRILDMLQHLRDELAAT